MRRLIAFALFQLNRTSIMNLAGRRVVFDTRVFPQIVGELAPLYDHALFVAERITRSCLAPVYS